VGCGWGGRRGRSGWGLFRPLWCELAVRSQRIFDVPMGVCAYCMVSSRRPCRYDTALPQALQLLCRRLRFESSAGISGKSPHARFQEASTRKHGRHHEPNNTILSYSSRRLIHRAIVHHRDHATVGHQSTHHLIETPPIILLPSWDKTL
jgi:hypothetical protein